MSLGKYTGQQNKLRELALEKLGCEKVSGMCDTDIGSFIEEGYAIFWGDCMDCIGRHSPDDEIIVLIPHEAYKRLFDSGDIVFVER